MRVIIPFNPDFRRSVSADRQNPVYLFRIKLLLYIYLPVSENFIINS
jgi:hypothetical protein